MTPSSDPAGTDAPRDVEPPRDAAFLAAESPGTPPRPQLPLPHWIAILAAFCAFVLIPWIVYLAIELPEHQRADHYDVAWVGFDIAMFATLAGLAAAAARRSTWTEPLAACAGTLLIVDAWFDVVTAHGRAELRSAITSAVFVELPLAVLCAWIALHAEQLRRRAYRMLWHRLSQADSSTADHN